MGRLRKLERRTVGVCDMCDRQSYGITYITHAYEVPLIVKTPGDDTMKHKY